MLVELHSHTYHSHGSKIYYDGISSPTAMVEAAKRIGLGAIAITDHNTMSGVKEAIRTAKGERIILIPAEEIETISGHIIALNIQESIKPNLDVGETVDLIHQQGGFSIAAHPYDVIQRYGLQEEAVRCDAVEVFNSLNMDRFSNSKSLRLARKNNIPGVSSSDAHCPEMLGFGTIEVGNNADSIDSIIRAIKKNNFTIHCNHPKTTVVAEWYVRRLQMSYSQILRYIDTNYRQPKRMLGKFGMKLVMKSPGKIDNFFNMVGYFVLGTAVAYGGIRRGIPGL